MDIFKRMLLAPTTRRVALKGVIGASSLAMAVRTKLSFAQEVDDEDYEDVEPERFSAPQTILIGGLDSRTEGEPENSDVIMLARVDLDAATLRVISIPRDLYIDIPGFGADKITRAYDFGSKAQNGNFNAGAELMKATIEYSFGIEVDSVILTTFHNFEDIVDAFDGVEVDLPYAVTDTEYPTLDYGYMTISFPEGEQEVDGEQALQLCRTRHQDGDPGRVMRQQLVLRGLLEKATSPEYAESLWDMVKEYKNRVRTDMSAARQMAYALAVPDFENDNIVFTNIDDYVYDDYAPNGAWIYSGVWDQLPGFVTGFLDGSIEIEPTIES
jgi:LCP family protein required for cell wall assembly